LSGKDGGGECGQEQKLGPHSFSCIAGGDTRPAGVSFALLFDTR
jgi:hypothetical protein